MARYDFTSPFVTLENVKLPSRRVFIAVLVGWLALWTTIVIGLIWVYAVWFQNAVGFQTAVLVGLALLVLVSEGGND